MDLWKSVGVGLFQSNSKELQGVIFIYKTKIAKVVCGLGIIGALGLASVQVDIPIPAYAETTKEDSIAKNVGKALADPVQETVESQYPYKAEGYDNLSDWLSAVKAKIQELQGKISESRNLEYLYDEDIAALDNIDANISNTFSLVTLGEYENTINSMFDKSAARKAEAEAAEKKKALEQQQQQKQESYTAPSGGGVLTPSSGVNMFNNRKETYYNLDMSGVVSNAKNMGIEGDYWVRGDGVKMYGNYVIVAAQMDKGTIIETSLGTGIVLDWCPAGTIDLAVSW